MRRSARRDLHPSARLVEGVFDDVDALASAAVEWDTEYEQLGRGRFHGKLTQLVLGGTQLNRESWSPGVLQRGAAPEGSWVFGLPLRSEGTLHVRRRPARAGELLTATSRDDIGFVATGPTDLMIVVLPNDLMDRWMQIRRGADGVDSDLPPRKWAVSGAEMSRRARNLDRLLRETSDQSRVKVTSRLLTHLQDRICDTILDMIPSAEAVEPFHTRARIARDILSVLYDRLDDPPTVTELCDAVGARERTVFLSCLEAYGRPPSHLLLELRLNVAHRALVCPEDGTNVTRVASQLGFVHFGRFSSMYARQFGELPSETLQKSLRSV